MNALKIPSSLKDMVINIASNSESSSILPMLETHRSTAWEEALTSIKSARYCAWLEMEYSYYKI